MIYIALLRGINVGRHNRMSMAGLRELFAAAGAEEVATHLQSGNVVFESRAGIAELGRRIERAIESSLGLQVSVLLRTKAQLTKVVAGNPFPAEGDAKKLPRCVPGRPSRPSARPRPRPGAGVSGRVPGRGSGDLSALPERLRPLETHQRLPRKAAGRRRNDAELEHRHGACGDRRCQAAVAVAAAAGQQSQPYRPATQLGSSTSQRERTSPRTPSAATSARRCRATTGRPAWARRTEPRASSLLPGQRRGRGIDRGPSRAESQGSG
jgi:hypothetical protein